MMDMDDRESKKDSLNNIWAVSFLFVIVILALVFLCAGYYKGSQYM